MRLAIKKEHGRLPMGGFDYLLMPQAIQPDEEHFYTGMGFQLITVTDEQGTRLIQEAKRALQHQTEIAYLVEESLKAKRS